MKSYNSFESVTDCKTSDLSVNISSKFLQTNRRLSVWHLMATNNVADGIGCTF